MAALTAPKLLAVYATIYEELKGRRIDGTGVVAISPPLWLRAAISRNDPAAIDEDYERTRPERRRAHLPELRRPLLVLRLPWRTKSIAISCRIEVMKIWIDIPIYHILQ